jgi:signal transduction histidine kinase
MSASASTSTSASKNRRFANKEIERKSFDNLCIAQCKMNSTLFMSFFFTLFPVIYYLNYLQMIDSESYILLTYTCSYFSKVLFTHLIADSHVEILDPNKFILIEQRRKLEETRLNFLRYVFHEVRVPLNSLVLGLQLLTSTSTSLASNTSKAENTSNSTANAAMHASNVKDANSMKMKAKYLQEERETLTMMKDATGFMSETLNDVLSLQKIEQGMFEMEYKVFTIERLLTTCLMNFR